MNYPTNGKDSAENGKEPLKKCKESHFDDEEYPIVERLVPFIEKKRAIVYYLRSLEKENECRYEN